MTAPLGRIRTKKMPMIEVFGRVDSRETRAAIRFFRERRIVVDFVDLRKRPLTVADLGALLDALGDAALLDDDDDSASAQAPEVEPAHRRRTLARLQADVALLRLPLVRYRDAVTAGRAESTWRAWLATGKTSPHLLKPPP